MDSDKCPRCDDYDDVVEELKKEKDTRERGSKDELRRCEEKNKSRDKKIRGLEKKILTITVAAVVGGTIVGKDVLDKIASYIQSFNSIKSAATKLTTSINNDSDKEVTKKDDGQQEELENMRTLTFAPRKFSTGEWPALMSGLDVELYERSKRVPDYGLSLDSLIDLSDVEMKSTMDIIIEDMLDKPFEMTTELAFNDDMLAPVEVIQAEFSSEPYAFSSTQVPEGSTIFSFSLLPILKTRRRK